MIPPASYYYELIAATLSIHRARYFEEGTYAVHVDNAYFFTNRQRRPRAAVECTVMRSNNANLPLGSSASWVVALDSDAAPASIRGFVECILPTVDTITASDVGRIFPEKTTGACSAAAGTMVRVIARKRPTRSGGEYTKVEWQPLPIKNYKEKQ